MTDKINHIEAYILAGGKSSRMGCDKGLILFKGKPLIERIIEELQLLFETVFIVSNNAEYKRFGLEVIEDLIKDSGPAGGIHAALSHSQTQNVFVTSCDMPFISAAAAGFIISKSGDSQITLPVFEERVHPLFGVYSRSCLPLWKQLIDLKMVKLQQMITHFDLSKIMVDHEPLFNEVMFMNVNDKNDLNKALQQL